jgi:hypothetical protein
MSKYGSALAAVCSRGIPSGVLSEEARVQQVLGPARDEFVFQKIVSADDGNDQAVHFGMCSPRPRFIERHAANRCDHVDPKGGKADLKYRSRILEIFRHNRSQRGAEFGEGTENALCVLRRGPDPEVYVAGGAWASMSGHGVRPDEKVFNLLVA